MDSIQDDLDATTEKIDELETTKGETTARINEIELRMKTLSDRQDKLEKQAVARADLIYRQGPVGLAEALFSAEDLSELWARVEMVSELSEQSNGVFITLARSQDELADLSDELTERRAALASATEDLESTVAELQDKLAAASDDYDALKKKLAAERAAAGEAAAPAESPGAPSGGPAPAVSAPSGGRVCPVAGPTSFVDSWGAPRVGHTHVGVDMMADYGTPLVAIVSGTITYSGYSGTGGNMLFLSGNDGNTYWYLHNQENIVTSGSVKQGQLIARVGDTGNAVGIPHLHFEYHPGGGGPVNPYPVVAAIC